MLRKRRTAEPTPPPLQPRWANAVLRAEEIRNRFEAIAARLAPGPTADVLQSLRGELDLAVQAVVSAATRADGLEATLESLDPDELARSLKDARRALARSEDDGTPSADLAERVASLDRQLGAAHRVWDAVDAAASQLETRLLALGEVVATAGVIVAHPTHQAVTEVDDLVITVRALAQALDELARP